MTHAITKIEEAARHLVTARKERRTIDRLPENCRPDNDEEALAVQRRVLELLGDTIGAWKASVPQPQGLFFAPIPSSAVRTASPCPILLQNGAARIEPEIAFKMARDLAPREKPYTESEVRDAIASAHLVLELMGGRYSNPKALPFPEWLADSINNQGLFVGPTVPNAFDRNLEALFIKISSPSGVVLTFDGKHPSGDPIKPLVWLANFLAGRGDSLKAGQIVTTGSYAGALDVPSGTPLTIEYGDAGSLSVLFTAV